MKANRKLATRAVRSVMRRNEEHRPGLAKWVAKFSADDFEVQKRQARILEKESGPASAERYLSSLADADVNESLIRLRARYLERAHDYDRASGLYESLVEHGGGDAATHNALARCYSEMEAFEQALKHAELAVAKGPVDPKAHERLLSLSNGVPGWKKLELLENGLDSHLESLEWRRKLAAVAFEMKRWKIAADHYEWCAEHSSDTNDSLRAGIANWRLNDQEKARRHWREAVKRDGRKIVQELGVGRILQERGLWPLASIAYEERILSSANQSHQLLHAAGFSYTRQYLWKKAVGYLQRAVQLSPSNQKYWYDLAFAYERSGRFSDAAIAYRASLDSSSPFAYRRYRLVSCLMKAGSVREAADALPAFEPQFGPDGEVLSWDNEELRKDLAHAKALSDSLKCNSVAEAAVNSGNDSLACEAFEAAEERSLGHDPALFVHHAACLYRLGREREAVEVYLRSKQFGDPHGLNVDLYLKTKAQRDGAVYLDYCQTLQVDRGIVLYESNHGGAITCSVKPILKRMLELNRMDIRLHVVVVNDRAKIPEDLIGFENVVFVHKSSNAYLKYLASAGWLISNNTFPPYFMRREEQRYLNLWHGTPMKTLGKDIKSGMMDHRNATRNFLHVTHMAMPNLFTTRVLLDRYDVARIFPGTVSVTGSPRMDVTLNLSGDTRDRIRRRLGADPNQRVVLFAPTWRGDLADKRVDVDQISADLRAMQAPDALVAFRGHPLMEEGLGDLNTDAVVVPPDIDTNELLGAVDVVVSDYSSIAIDSVGGGVRTILYVYDRAEYESERGLYMDLEDLPMEVVATRDELSAAIMIRERAVPEDLGPFEEMWQHEDGKATDRVIDFFFEDKGTDRSDFAPTRKRKEVVLFQGHFIPNGVTASARELDRFLANEDIGVTLSVEAAKVLPFPEREVIFREVAKNAYVLPTVGAALRTPEEIWLNSIFMMQDELWSEEQMDRLRDAYRREYRRLYGYAEFDTAVCFEGYTRYWVLVMAGAPEDVRKVIYLHSDMKRESRQRFPYLDGVAKAYPWYDKVVSVSVSANESNSRAFDADRGSQVFCAAENLIDPDGIRSASEEECGERFNRFVGQHSGQCLISVGRLSVEKNVEALVEAFSICKRPGDGLVIVGDGPERSKIEWLAERNGLRDDVFFAGYRENPHKFVRRCDLFVLPSLFEGQGIAVLEALTLGIPVVASDIPGPRSILERGGGLLVEPTPQGIASGIEQVRSLKSLGQFSVEAYVENARNRHLEVLGL